MVLTSATQELFECRADEDVTGDNPYKLLRKEDMMQDMRTRAAVSDFSPIKQAVLVSLSGLIVQEDREQQCPAIMMYGPMLRAVQSRRASQKSSGSIATTPHYLPHSSVMRSCVSMQSPHPTQLSHMEAHIVV